MDIGRKEESVRLDRMPVRRLFSGDEKPFRSTAPHIAGSSGDTEPHFSGIRIARLRRGRLTTMMHGLGCKSPLHRLIITAVVVSSIYILKRKAGGWLGEEFEVCTSYRWMKGVGFLDPTWGGSSHREYL